MVFSNGNVYQGDFKMGIIHGNGVMNYKHEGEYEGDLRCGLVRRLVT